MKLKFIIFGLCFSLCFPAVSHAADPGLRHIITRGVVRCGTDLSTKTYAYKDEAKIWRGIDADLCRVFATAIFGHSNQFQLVDVKAYEVSKALATGKIDIMLGDAPATATRDISTQASLAAVAYYDRQMFLAKNRNAESMEAYKNETICAVTNSEDLFNVQEYNAKYNLGLKTLLFREPQKAKEAFLLNRCTLLTGNELYLKSIYKQMADADMDIVILPEVVALKPVYVQVSRANNTLRITAKWILNALALSEKLGINSKNADIFIGINDTSTKNLLGVDTTLWKRFMLKPQWVKTVLNELGNLGEIYEKNLGSQSEYNVERGKNNLIDNGGLIIWQPFL